MSNLTLIKQANFGAVQFDFYQDEHGEFAFTREQIGRGLEYAYANDAIRKIHERHKDRLDQFSVSVKLTGTDGKRYNTTVYTAKGVYEICRWSEQPKADALYDWIYEMLESLRRGDAAIVQFDDLKRKELEIKHMRAEAMLINANVRKAKLIMKAENGALSAQSVALLQINALEGITEKLIADRPEVKGKLYSATEIGEITGFTANWIGKIAKRYNLKTDEYGIFVLDKSRSSNKQVDNFRYNERGLMKFKELLADPENWPKNKRIAQ